MNVRRTWRAVPPGMALLLAPLATPAQAANYSAVYSTGTGFGTQAMLSANAGDTVTVTNHSVSAVAFAHVGICAQTYVAAPGTSVMFTMCADTGLIVAAGAGVQPVLLIV
jgi:hypothetical protein